MHVSTESTSAGGAAWELELRRLAATDDDTARGMFLQGSLDVIGFLGGDGAAARCRGVAGLWDINPYHMYPVSRFLRIAATASRLMAPQSYSFDRVLRQMGTQATVDFLASMFGRDLMQTAAGSPRKLLQSLGDAYRSSVSYGERYPLWTGETSARFIMRASKSGAPCSRLTFRVSARTVAAMRAVGAVQYTGRSGCAPVTSGRAAT